MRAALQSPAENTALRLRQYLANHAKGYPGIWKQIDIFLAGRGKGLPSWENWCFLPMAASHAIASAGMHPHELPPEEAQILGVRTAVIAALAAWRPAQGIFRFHPEVFKSLWDTPLEGELPVELFYRLPQWCCYIETPGKYVLDGPLSGFFVHLEDDVNNINHHELRLLLDFGSETKFVPVCLHMDEKTIPGMVASLEKEAEIILKRLSLPKSHLPNPDTLPIIRSRLLGATNGTITSLLSLVLYLCSASSEFRASDGSLRQPAKTGLTRTKKGLRLFPAEKPSIWETGYRIGRTLEAARRDRQSRSEARGGTHESPEPHIRNAHWHGFWKGPRNYPERRRLEVRWMPPIPVGFKSGDPEEVIPTIYSVK